MLFRSQADIDAQRIQTFTQLEPFPYFSKRFLMKRYLGMTEQEIADNESSWAEEQGDADLAKPEAPGLRGTTGISPGGIESDLDALGPAPEAAGQGGPGLPGAAPATAAGGLPGAAPAPAL